MNECSRCRVVLGKWNCKHAKTKCLVHMCGKCLVRQDLLSIDSLCIENTSLISDYCSPKLAVPFLFKHSLQSLRRSSYILLQMGHHRAWGPTIQLIACMTKGSSVLHWMTSQSDSFAWPAQAELLTCPAFGFAQALVSSHHMWILWLFKTKCGKAEDQSNDSDP